MACACCVEELLEEEDEDEDDDEDDDDDDDSQHQHHHHHHRHHRQIHCRTAASSTLSIARSASLTSQADPQLSPSVAGRVSTPRSNQIVYLVWQQ